MSVIKRFLILLISGNDRYDENHMERSRRHRISDGPG